MEYKITVNEEKRDSVLKATKQKIIFIQLIYGAFIASLISLPFIIVKMFWLFILMFLLVTAGITLFLSHSAFKTINTSHEEITVKDDSFTFSFIDHNKSYHKNVVPSGEVHERDEVEFYFKDIKKVEVNHNYNLVIIYGPMDFRLFKDYHRKIIKKVLRVDKPKNYLVLTGIYDEMEQFVRYVSNETGLPLTHVYLPGPMKSYKRII